MNVIAIQGGLGNQMFQYAFGQYLKAHTREDVVYDASTFVIRRRRRAYGLGEFVCAPNVLQSKTAYRQYRVSPILRLFGVKPKLTYIDEDSLSDASFERLTEVHDAYLSGYFQDPVGCHEIRDRLLRDFQLRAPTESFLRKSRELSGLESVAVHVRRGDYVGLGLTDCCPPDYYAQAAELVTASVGKVHYYVFSDDIAWARDHLAFLSPVEFVAPFDSSRPVLDMMLMKSCRHNIIANSTFSWWSAFLNDTPDRVVVAPKMWSAVASRVDKCPKEWLRV